jgi:hypothetical protein
MSKLRTHYDNLKVSHDAPVEVIRAAYKSLSQKFHPDRNPDNPHAGKIMAIINTSYEVLSDPAKRREHDLWIQEKERAATPPPPFTHDSTARDYRATGSQRAQSEVRRKRSSRLKILILFLAFIVVWLWFAGNPTSPTDTTKPYNATPPEMQPQLTILPPPAPAYSKPSTAPNGTPWPAAAGYVTGFKRLHTNGLSNVTVDNGRNDSDVFVKLVSLDGPEAYPVRQFFIPAYGKFTVNKVRAGSYDVRYRDLDTGALSRSERFTLEEVQDLDGSRYSSVTMTLYKVQNGNMQTYGLAESEF